MDSLLFWESGTHSYTHSQHMSPAENGSSASSYSSLESYSAIPHVSIVPSPNPSYLYPGPTGFEYIDLSAWKKWFHLNWIHSVYYSVAYVIVIFGLQAFMQHRKPYQLRGALTVWSAGLAIFSIAAFVRTLPELLHTLSQPNGLHRSVCTREDHNMATAFWFLLMPLSKVVELGDTLFIVLRKQNLMFLHWYHHITVMMYCWRVYEYYAPVFNWFATINFGVHSIMYTYYTFKALKFNIPRNFAMVITILQISQMVAGISLNVYTLTVKRNGGECERENDDLNLALSMYASYFVLFAKFFHEAYFVKKPATVAKVRFAESVQINEITKAEIHVQAHAHQKLKSG